MHLHLQPCWMHMLDLETLSLTHVEIPIFASHVLLHLERLPHQFVETSPCAYPFLFAVAIVSSTRDISGSSYLQQAVCVSIYLAMPLLLILLKLKLSLQAFLLLILRQIPSRITSCFPIVREGIILKSGAHFHGGYRILDTIPFEIIVIIAKNDRCRLYNS